MEPVREAFFVRGGGWGSVVWRVAGLIFYVRCSWRGGDGRMRLSLSQAGAKEAALFGGAIAATPSVPGARRRPAPPPSDIGWARQCAIPLFACCREKEEENSE